MCHLVVSSSRASAIRWTRACALRVALAVGGLFSGFIAPAGAQDDVPLTFVNENTSVRSVNFQAEDGLIYEPNLLQEQIATLPPPSGLIHLATTQVARFFRTYQPGTYPFSPFELEKDVVRLRRFYARNGFPRAAVDYTARLDTSANDIRITFEIAKGPPLLISEVEFAGPGNASVTDQLSPDLARPWTTFQQRVQLQEGQRLDENSLLRLQREVRNWLRNRGYPFVNAGAERYVDSLALEARVRLKVLAGPRARVDAIDFEGLETLSESMLRRELPFSEGDLFEAAKLETGQQNLFGLGLFQLALVEAASDQPRDSTVTIKVRVREGEPRALTGFFGYYSYGGFTVRGGWTHRNFIGGARTFNVTLEARSGILGTNAVRGQPITDYQASLSLRQPYVFTPNLSLTASPNLRFRDDEIEQSRQLSLSTSLLYERAPFQTASLAASLRRSTVFPEEGLVFPLYSSGGIALRDSTNITTTTTTLSLGATFGLVDDAVQPTQGLILRPGAAAAGLLPGSDFEYVRLRLAATGLLPLTNRIGLTTRLTGGFFRPFGGTTPDSLLTYTLLRDQFFYAGGTDDVRGWPERSLGPKIFNLIAIREDETEPPQPSDELEVFGYLPLGGHAKASGSLQLNLPLPGFGSQWASNVFVDAGRIFRPNRTYVDDLFSNPDSPEQARAFERLRPLFNEPSTFRVGVGGGIQYLTPIGFVGISMGVKVNPSFLDARSPEDLLDLYQRALNGDPLDDIPGGSLSRRLQLHFAIGQSL